MEDVMPYIRPISDLRNRAHEISDLCHQEGQPVYITRNGKGDMVVMSQAHYEQMRSLLDLYQKLSEAETLDAAGESGMTHDEMMERLRSRIR